MAFNLLGLPARPEVFKKYKAFDCASVAWPDDHVKPEPTHFLGFIRHFLWCSKILFPQSLKRADESHIQAISPPSQRKDRREPLLPSRSLAKANRILPNTHPLVSSGPPNTKSASAPFRLGTHALAVVKAPAFASAPHPCPPPAPLRKHANAPLRSFAWRHERRGPVCPLVCPTAPPFAQDCELSIPL